MKSPPTLRAWFTDDGIEVESTDIDPATVEAIIARVRRPFFQHRDLAPEPGIHEYRLFWDPALGDGTDAWLYDGEPTGTRQDLVDGVVAYLTR